MDSGEGKTIASAKCGWKVNYNHVGIYTGGKFEFTEDGDQLVCMCSDNVAVVSAQSGTLVYKVLKEAEVDDDDEFEQAGERVTTFALHPSGKSIVTASDSQLLKHWQLEDDKAVLVKSWRGHEGPILTAQFHKLGDLMATGSSDRTVKVWSVKGGYCTHNFKGHRSIITALQFHPDPQRLHLFSSDNAGSVRLWSLLAGQDKNEMDDIYRQHSNQHAEFNNHLSAVTAIAFSESGNVLVTAGRDKVVNLWDIEDGSSELLKTVPVYESLEGVAVIPDSSSDSNSDTIQFATTGEKGSVRIWKYSVSDPRQQCTCALEQKSDGKYSHLGLRYHPRKQQLVIANVENNLIFLKPESLHQERQLIGYNDEILDIKHMHGDDSSIVVATNSNHAQIINLETFNSKMLTGHDDVVLSVDVSKDGKYIATSSKDNTCRIWEVETLKCVAICRGHTEAVTCVAFLGWSGVPLFPKKQKTDNLQPLLVSAGSDKTLKIWTANSKRPLDTEEYILNAESTRVAHDKVINALALAPNKSMIATASQDKTIKLWSSNPFEQKGTLQGHRRGVWAVQFSPVEKCVASASADKTIRLWSVSDFSCISVFEGHEASVIRVQFLKNGTGFLSGSSSGVLKLWSIKKNECIGTMEHHQDRVWAISMGANDKEMVTGGGDSSITIWKDMSEEINQEEMLKKEEDLLKEEEMQQSEWKRNYKLAALRALELNRPHRLRNILTKIMSTRTAEEDMSSFINSLDEAQIRKCWLMARDWNTMGRNCSVAQFMISNLLKNSRYSISTTANVDLIIKPLLAYSERHQKRIEKIIESSFLLDHALGCMNQEGK